MKTIAFRDISGGSIQCYFNKKKPMQKRWDRFFEGLSDLSHTGNICIYRTNMKKTKLLTIKRY